MFHRQVSDPPLGQNDVRLAKGIQCVIRILVDAFFWTGKKEKTKVHHLRSVVDLYDVWSQSSYEQAKGQNGADQMKDLLPRRHSMRLIWLDKSDRYFKYCDLFIYLAFRFICKNRRRKGEKINKET